MTGDVFFKLPRAVALPLVEAYLENTTWSRGVYTEKFQVPGARPSQIRAAARKKYDVIKAEYRRTKTA